MIVITGATGQTGSKIANLLLKKEQKIRVIARSENKLKPFKEKGAEIAVGDQSDVRFLTGAFSNSDAVYLLIPPKMDAPDIRAYYNSLGDIAIKALLDSGVKKVVLLSSIGAELTSGTGPVLGLHDIETKMNKLTQIDIAFLRPAYFMENFLSNVSLIKHSHINVSTMSPDNHFAVIATRDIAKKAAELLMSRSFTGHNIIDLFGDRISYHDATKLIGEAIGKPDLPCIQVSISDALKSMTDMGLSENFATSLIEMSTTIGKGIVKPSTIDPLKPNTDTRFVIFVNEVFRPVFESTD